MHNSVQPNIFFVRLCLALGSFLLISLLVSLLIAKCLSLKNPAQHIKARNLDKDLVNATAQNMQNDLKTTNLLQFFMPLQSIIEAKFRADIQNLKKKGLKPPIKALEQLKDSTLQSERKKFLERFGDLPLNADLFANIGAYYHVNHQRIMAGHTQLAATELAATELAATGFNNAGIETDSINRPASLCSNVSNVNINSTSIAIPSAPYPSLTCN